MNQTDRDQLRLDDAALRLVDPLPDPLPIADSVRDQARLERWELILHAYERAARDPRLTNLERDGWAESARLLRAEQLAARARLRAGDLARVK